ncbi:hypothetical protein [Paenibacillus piri]|uniref:Uncharacterized protein n=1 Tax=Paenibacillus piri TaxID=2547395 RepID=A0A4R5KYN2_9BACL|nr:hypothetical protein [Paenibacillus piri]TDG00248.1 hypothetical protein E1757_00990 [Paenibacillus piri]
MSDELRRRIMEAKERKFRLYKAERRQGELQKAIREQDKLIIRLEVELESEQLDVDNLTRLSLANLFHTILRTKEEQLELERQQALAAALKLQEARQALSAMEKELIGIGNDLADYGRAEQEYDALMAEKVQALRTAPYSSGQLLRMEENIADQSVHVMEIGEALSAGRSVLAALEDASACLDKAENWGKWDMWGGGGMISTHIKHGHVDDAKQYISNANRLMQRFHSELADLNRSVDIHIDISGLLKLADYWFDGLIVDWVVQGRIQNAHDQVLEALHQIRSVTRQLQAEHAAAESSLTAMKAKCTAWIEQSSLDE